MIYHHDRCEWCTYPFSTLNSPISVWKISLVIFSMGHTNFMAKVEFTWVQNHELVCMSKHAYYIIFCALNILNKILINNFS